MYALDINRFIQWLLPAATRKAAHVAWLNALLAPLKWLHTQFLNWSISARYDLRITGQVRSLQFHMNRIWYNGGTNIFITDTVVQDQVFIYLESENQPLYLPDFISGSASDFIVHVPNAIVDQFPAIRAFLNKYKLPSKRYEVVGYGPFF